MGNKPSLRWVLEVVLTLSELELELTLSICEVEVELTSSVSILDTGWREFQFALFDMGWSRLVNYVCTPPPLSRVCHFPHVDFCPPPVQTYLCASHVIITCYIAFKAHINTNSVSPYGRKQTPHLDI